jgi:hypothetical protein
MNHYDFKKDHKENEVVEDYVKNWLYDNMKPNTVYCCNDNRYDFRCEYSDGSSITYELKHHILSKKTGNISVEFECRGNKSGIEVSQADIYLHIFYKDDRVYMLAIYAKKMKRMIFDRKYHKIVIGGDVGSQSKSYLFTIQQFIDECIFCVPFEKRTV